MALDDKQKRLIDAWLKRADDSSMDEYGRFMAVWIAFNALCYALFALKASHRRPDLSEDRGLTGLDQRVSAEGWLEPRGGGRVRLRIEKPGKIQLDIQDRYSEDIIFSEFARVFSPLFTAWLKEEHVLNARDGFLAELKKERGTYVVNMLRVEDYNRLKDNQAISLADLRKRNVVVPVNKPEDLREVVPALYQVRCNVFHGEKVPGEPNDDRIVKAARPLLVEIVRHALSSTV